LDLAGIARQVTDATGGRCSDRRRDREVGRSAAAEGLRCADVIGIEDECLHRKPPCEQRLGTNDSGPLSETQAAAYFAAPGSRERFDVRGYQPSILIHERPIPLCDAQHTKHVSVEHLLDLIETFFGQRWRRGKHHTGIVDQHIQPVRVVGQRDDGTGDARILRHIQLHSMCFYAFGTQPLRVPLYACRAHAVTLVGRTTVWDTLVRGLRGSRCWFWY